MDEEAKAYLNVVHSHNVTYKRYPYFLSSVPHFSFYYNSHSGILIWTWKRKTRWSFVCLISKMIEERQFYNLNINLQFWFFFFFGSHFQEIEECSRLQFSQRKFKHIYIQLCLQSEEVGGIPLAYLWTSD